MIENNIAISLSKINKSYSATTVFKSLNCDFKNNDQVLLIGANGSGKSTLLKLIAGISKPDHGKCVKNIAVSYSNYEYGFYDSLTVIENYKLFLDLNNISTSYIEELKQWGLFKHKDYEVSKLSSGLKQRLNLAQAFSLKKSFLLLDEPTAFLDQEGISIFKKILEQDLNKQILSGYIIATHDISLLKSLTSRVIMLDAGVIKADSRQVDNTLNSYLNSNL
jgi:ABC-type multidrug transport system ATPase subunit